MCWSGEASAAIAIGGLSSAYYLKKRGNPKDIYIPTAYFVLMEGLQALTYLVVNDPSSAWNQWAARAAIIHISFQPIFINMLGMHFIDKKVRHRIKKWVYAFTFMIAAFNLSRMIPPGTGFFEFWGACDVNTALCSTTTTFCFKGEWHIGWQVVMNAFNGHWEWYIFAAFGLPVLYGSWRWSLYHALVGPILASLTTSNIHERPAVWCLLSTMIIALMVNTPVRQYIYIKSWPLWKFILRDEGSKKLESQSE